MIEINELVKRLGTKQHVEAKGGRQGTGDGFKEAFDRGHVFVKFTKTQGGTELGTPLNKAYTDVSGVDWAAKTGVVKFAGELALNYERVRLHAEIDLSTLEGEAYLEYIEPVEEWRKAKMSS